MHPRSQYESEDTISRGSVLKSAYCSEQETISTLKHRRQKNPDDWLKYRKLRNKVNIALRKAEKEYYDDLAQNQCNLQAVWKELNKITGKGCKKCIGTIHVNGHDITQSQDKTSTL